MIFSSFSEITDGNNESQRKNYMFYLMGKLWFKTPKRYGKAASLCGQFGLTKVVGEVAINACHTTHLSFLQIFPSRLTSHPHLHQFHIYLWVNMQQKRTRKSRGITRSHHTQGSDIMGHSDITSGFSLEGEEMLVTLYPRAGV